MRFELAGQEVFAYTGARPLEPGRPTVVFIHGAGMDHSVWNLQSRWFAHHGRNVLAFDLPGHGRSGGAPLASIEALADWVEAALGHLGVERAALVGHSMGALVALDGAARHPRRAGALALLGCAQPMPVSDALLEAARSGEHAAFDMITLWGHGAAARLGANPSPGMWMMGSALRLLERSAPAVLYRDLSACNAYLAGLERAAEVACPALVVVGRQDLMTPARAGRALAGALPEAHIVELDCGHMMMAEAPEAVREALAQFLASW